MQLMMNAKQPRKLWKTILSVIGTGNPKQQKGTLLTADDLLKYFNDKVVGVRQSTGNVPVQSFLPPAAVEFNEFEVCTQDEVLCVICKAPTKSGCLDPVPTDILKELLV